MKGWLHPADRFPMTVAALDLAALIAMAFAGWLPGGMA